MRSTPRTTPSHRVSTALACVAWAFGFAACASENGMVPGTPLASDAGTSSPSPDGETPADLSVVPPNADGTCPSSRKLCDGQCVSTTNPQYGCDTIGGVGTNGSTLSTVEAYNPSTDTWQAVASMPTKPSAFAAAATGGRIFAIGGAGIAGISPATLAYNPSTDTWQAVASMSTARNDLAAAAGSDGRIFGIGGLLSTGSTASTAAYNPSTDTWQAVASMSTARYGLATAVEPDGRIFAIGGAAKGSILTTWRRTTRTPTSGKRSRACPLLAPTSRLRSGRTVASSPSVAAARVAPRWRRTRHNADASPRRPKP